MWNLFLHGLEGKVQCIVIDNPNPEKMTVTELKGLIQKVTNVLPEHQRLIYGGKMLEDKKVLADYKSLGDGANIFLVLRLLGGSQVATRVVAPSLPRSDNKCMIIQEDFKEDSLTVLKMPCSHPISPDGLMDYAWSEVSSNQKTEIKCPLCSTEWPLEVVKEYGGATPTELEQLEMGLSRNFCTKSSDINQCPKCRSYCTRANPAVNSVNCIICSRKCPGFHFCWHCLKEWKASLSSSSCGNPGCSDVEKLSQLRNCGKVKVKYVPIEIFKFRACPSCGTIIELAEGCKHMTCKACKVEFCFVCLRKKSQGSWQCGSYNTKCDPAPVQTVIPRR